MQAMAFNWLGIHNCYLVLCGLVEQPNITQYNLCLVVCNGDETKLHSNFVKTKTESLKNLKDAIPRSNGKFNPELKKIQNQDQMFLLTTFV
jgi:hypothetical protein